MSELTFTDPEAQAQHEQNLEWLRLMREDPGWVLSRLHRLSAIAADRDRLLRIETAAQVFLDAARIYDKTAWGSTPPDDRCKIASAYTEARDALSATLNEQSEGG